MTTTTDRIDPVAVLVPPQIASLVVGQYEAIAGWLRGQGINPDDTMRVEIYRIDRADTAYYAHVSAFLRDGEGRRYCDEDHEHGSFPDRCQLASCSYLVMLSAFPPKATGLDVYKEWAR